MLYNPNFQIIIFFYLILEVWLLEIYVFSCVCKAGVALLLSYSLEYIRCLSTKLTTWQIMQ